MTTYYSALSTLVLTFARTLLPNDATEQTSIFPDAKFDVQFQELVNEGTAKLDLIKNAKNIKEDFLNTEICRSTRSGSVRIIDAFQYAPTITSPIKLPNAQFGKDGFYTEAVC